MRRSSRSVGFVVTLALFGALGAGCAGAEPTAAAPGPSPAVSADPDPMDELRAGFTKLTAAPYVVTSRFHDAPSDILVVRTEFDETRALAHVQILGLDGKTVVYADYIRTSETLYVKYHPKAPDLPGGVAADRWYRLKRSGFAGDPTEFGGIQGRFSLWADALVTVERTKFYAFKGTIDLSRARTTWWLQQRFPDGGAALPFEATTDAAGHVSMIRYTVPATSENDQYVQELRFFPEGPGNRITIEAPTGQTAEGPNALYSYRF